MTRLQRRAIGAAVITALAGLGGCANEGIELNGKIFDALGVSTSSIAPRKEPRMEQRSPIVLPPDGKRLPEPGSAPESASQNQNWPQDREVKRVADAEEAKRKQAEFCRDGNWKEKAMKDEVGAEAKAPGGNCGSIFSTFSKGLFGNQE
ncbi:MAG: hypothetical protein ACKVP3_15650 [Hyphomicrobiaceae bacterium]